MHLFSFLSLFFLPLCLSYKVIVFSPAVGASHSNFLGKISDILLDAGHNVTLFIPILLEKEKHLVGSKKVQNIVRVAQDPRASSLMKEMKIDEILRKASWEMNNDFFSIYKIFNTMNIATGYQCEYIFQQPELLDQLQAEQFDLAIAESLYVCAHAFFERIQVKTFINADSTIFQHSAKIALGEPASTSYYPSLFTSFTDKMGFLQRAQNFLDFQMGKFFTTTRYQYELAHLNTNWEQYWDKVAFNFVNSNSFLDFPSPTLPKTIFVGGMQVATRKTDVKLSEKWDNFLNKKQKNVLISFGSVFYSSQMPAEYKAAFLKVFESMPDVTFIWKYEEANSTIASHLENVILTTWMPQNDLLADKRLSLFITHGGLGSTTELAYQGKPAIVIPLIGDQPRNARMLARHGGALQLEKSQLNEPEIIKKAIETVLTDPSYKTNAKRLADILDQQPYKPKDVVLKHCDFAVQFGNLKTLDSEGRNQNFIVYNSLDIAFAGLVAIVILLLFFELGIKLIFRVVRNKTKLKHQ